jgi:hypothetical protein
MDRISLFATTVAAAGAVAALVWRWAQQPPPLPARRRTCGSRDSAYRFRRFGGT